MGLFSGFKTSKQTSPRFSIIGMFLETCFFILDSSDGAIQCISKSELDELVHSGVDLKPQMVVCNEVIHEHGSFGWQEKMFRIVVKDGEDWSGFDIRIGLVDSSYHVLYGAGVVSTVGSVYSNLVFMDNYGNKVAYAVTIKEYANGKKLMNYNVPCVTCVRQYDSKAKGWYKDCSVCVPSEFISYIFRICRMHDELAAKNLFTYKVMQIMTGSDRFEYVERVCGKNFNKGKLVFY